MTLQSVAPLRFKGVKSDWLSTLPNSGTEMLTISSTGVVSRQAIPSASFGALTGLPSDNATLQSALDAKANSSSLANYLPLAGGTLTGGLVGTTGIFSGSLQVPRLLSGTGNLLIIDGGSGISIRHNTSHQHAFATGSFITRGDNYIGWTNGSDMSHPLGLSMYRDGTDTLGLRRGTNANRLNLYGTYTDASNYRRLYISSTTAGAFTLGVEGLGTGASGNTLAIGNDLTVNGNVYAGATSEIGFTGRTRITSPSNDVLWLNGTATSNGVQLSLGNGVLNIRDRTNSGPGAMTASTISLSAATDTPLNITSSSTNVTTFGVVSSSSNIGWAFQVGGSSPGTGAPAGSFTFRQTTDNINTGIIASDGRWAIGASNPHTATQLAVVSRAAGNIVGVFRGAASQTGNLTEWQDSAGNQLLLVNADGTLRVPTGSGIIFSSSGNSSFRISQFGNQTYLDNNAGGPIRFRTNGSITQNLELFHQANPVGALVAVGIAIGDSGTRIMQDSTHILAQRNGANTQTFRIYNAFTDSSNYIRQALSFTTYSSTVHAQYAAEGLGTGAVNIPMVITPRGTGAFILGPMPDGTSTGGNARGSRAVDLQIQRDSASQIASGAGSFIGGGYRNSVTSNYGVAFGIGCTVSGGNEGNLAGGYESTASGGQSSLAWGNRCTASGVESSWVIGYESAATSNGSIAVGRNARSDRAYQYSHSAGMFSTGGDSQYTRFVLKNRTTDATPTVLVGGTFPSWTTRLTINASEVFGFIANITGSKSDGTAVAHYVRKGLIKRISNTTTLAYVETVGTDYEDNAATNVAITADDTNDALQISVTGIAGETWRWVATVEAVDLGFGT